MAKTRSGFTLVEVIVILVVVSILAALAIPVALRIFERTAEDTTREEMENIRKAILGDVQKLQGSFRNDFGYLGDIGCLPSTTIGDLDRLITQGSLSAWSFDSTKQAGAGWKGPYITGTPGEDFKKDQLGNDYIYTPAAGACPLTATLTSNGPDGLPSTADDITVNIVANDTTATLRGTVKNTSGVGLAGVPVELYFPSNGTLTTSSPATTDTNGNYSFSSVPFGARAVKPNPTLVLVPGSVIVSGGGNRNVEFDVINYSGSSVTVASVNVVTCPGAVRYDDIEFDNQAVDTGNDHPCGTNISVSGGNTAFNANPTPPSSLRVVVDSPDTQLPDLTLRGGITRHIELIRFETAAGAPVNMSGKTLTVTFNLVAGGSATMTVVTP
jgi:general secretion pathway protein G